MLSLSNMNTTFFIADRSCSLSCLSYYLCLVCCSVVVLHCCGCSVHCCVYRIHVCLVLYLLYSATVCVSVQVAHLFTLLPSSFFSADLLPSLDISRFVLLRHMSHTHYTTTHNIFCVCVRMCMWSAYVSVCVCLCVHIVFPLLLPPLFSCWLSLFASLVFFPFPYPFPIPFSLSLRTFLSFSLCPSLCVSPSVSFVSFFSPFLPPSFLPPSSPPSPSILFPVGHTKNHTHTHRTRVNRKKKRVPVQARLHFSFVGSFFSSLFATVLRPSHMKRVCKMNSLVLPDRPPSRQPCPSDSISITHNGILFFFFGRRCRIDALRYEHHKQRYEHT